MLLRHTERFTTLTQAEHLAVDAVINAIIHRSLGPDYSGMMSRYYADERGVARLLRPPTDPEVGSRRTRISWGGLRASAEEKRVLSAWHGLYTGQLVADDIRDLARDLVKRRNAHKVSLLGDHENLASGTSGDATPTGPLADALDTALKAMNGSGVFRSPNGRGVGADAYRNEVRAADTAVDRWRQETFAVLRRHLLPDPRSIAREPSSRSFSLPVLSPGDRRAALRSLWSPFLPDARWETEHTARAGSAHVYLDVSGSMNAEMPLVVALLGEALDLHPPSLLGVQQRGRAGAHRAGTLDRRHDGRHQHGLRAGSRGAHEAAGRDCRHRRLHRSAPPEAGCRHRRHAPARHRHARWQRGPSAARRLALHAVIEVAVMIRMSEVVLPGHPDKFCDQVADADRGRVLQGRSPRLLPGRDERLVRPGLPHRRNRHA